MKGRGNKYGAVKKRFLGHVYDSTLEADVAEQLWLSQAGGEIGAILRQYSVDLRFYDSKGNHIYSRAWKVDFCVTELDDTLTLVEAKGLAMQDYKQKENHLKRVWLLDNPGFQYICLKSAGEWAPKRLREKILPRRY